MNLIANFCPNLENSLPSVLVRATNVEMTFLEEICFFFFSPFGALWEEGNQLEAAQAWSFVALGDALGDFGPLCVTVSAGAGWVARCYIP